MKRRTRIWLTAILVLVSTAAIYGYCRWRAQNSSTRDELLNSMPADANAVLFVDLHELRSAPFIAQLYAWAPKPQADPDYAQFVKDTGFDYERDLDRIALAFAKSGGTDSTFFAVADGKFDRAKISAFALKTGTATKTGSREIFSLPSSDGSRRISFAFLQSNRIALTSRPDFAALLHGTTQSNNATEWRTRFKRLAGSPIFAVVRQDAAVGAALAAQAPGGLRSPQLSTLLDQLQWISIAGKPQNERLQVVAEGESTAEATTRQLADVLNGVLLLAEAGLNDAKTRQQLDPSSRAAYLELLKSANVDKIDRGDTKSVRMVFDITPALLEAASRTPSQPQATVPSKPLGKPAATKKGHT